MDKSAKLTAHLNYARTGMTEQKLQVIGASVLMWNSMEIAMRRLTWRSGELPDEKGALITIDLPVAKLKELAGNLLLASSFAEKTKEEGLLVHQIFDEMRQRRNALVHGTPVYGEHGRLMGRLARFSASKSKGVVLVKSVDVTDEELSDLLEDMVLSSEYIADNLRKIENEVEYRAKEGLRGRYSFEGFVYGYRAPAIDSTKLKKFRDNLVKKRPKGGVPISASEKPHI